MMDRLTPEQLTQLMSVRRDPCISVYFPTHRAGPEVQQDHIRCKNLYALALEKLRDFGMRPADAEKLLHPMQELIDNEIFWANQSQGLALLISAEGFHRFRVPLQVPEQVILGQRYHLAPLLPLLQNDGLYYVLAVSQNDLRLYEGTRWTIDELVADQLPEDLMDALNVDEWKSSLQWKGYTERGVGAIGSGEAMYHGHGDSDPGRKKQDELIEYMRRIDNALEDFFHSDRRPLVFAGVEELLPLFQQTCSYRELVDKPAHGNPEGWSLEELHAKTWPLVEPRFREELNNRLERYGEKAGHQLASDDIGTVLAAANQGAIDTLFLADNHEFWAKLNEQTGELTPCEEGEPGSEDMVDRIAHLAFDQSARIFTLPPDEKPGQGPIAAMFRFELPTVSPGVSGNVNR